MAPPAADQQGELLDMEVIIGSGKFCADQFSDPAFQHTYDEGVVCCNGELLQPSWVLQLLCFEVKDDLLHCITKGKVPGPVVSQLSVPQRHRVPVIRLAPDGPMVGRGTWAMIKWRPTYYSDSFGWAFIKKYGINVKLAQNVR